MPAGLRSVEQVWLKRRPFLWQHVRDKPWPRRRFLRALRVHQPPQLLGRRRFRLRLQRQRPCRPPWLRPRPRRPKHRRSRLSRLRRLQEFPRPRHHHPSRLRRPRGFPRPRHHHPSRRRRLLHSLQRHQRLPPCSRCHRLRSFRATTTGLHLRRRPLRYPRQCTKPDRLRTSCRRLRDLSSRVRLRRSRLPRGYQQVPWAESRQHRCGRPFQTKTKMARDVRVF